MARYKQDVLGLRRGREFDLSSRTHDWKFGTHMSHARQWSEITAERIGPDIRVLRSLYRDDGKRYHAFDRGDVTVGWQQSTRGGHEKERAQLTESLTTRSQKSTALRSQRLSAYQTPTECVTALSEAQRRAKTAQQLPRRQALGRFGHEGAAHLQLIAAVLQRNGGYHARKLQTKQEDVAAVRALEFIDDDARKALLRSFTSMSHWEPQNDGEQQM